MDKKLTDSEIVTTLNEADGMEHIAIYCADGKGNEMKSIPMVDIVDLINRLQAQVKKCEKVEHFADKTIATLQAENEDYKALYEGLKAEHIETIKAIKHCKAEAYKEFAEKLENRILSMLTTATLEEKEIICACIGTNNNVLKELVGEDNESKN